MSRLYDTTALSRDANVDGRRETIADSRHLTAFSSPLACICLSVRHAGVPLAASAAKAGLGKVNLYRNKDLRDLALSIS